MGLPPSPVEFSFHCHFYKLSCSWLLGVCHRSCLLRPAFLFTVPWGISPPPASALREPCSLCYVSFLLLLLIISVFFLYFSFFPGWGWSVQGAMLIWSRAVCGSTACRLAHLVVCVFPSSLDAAVWQWRRSPPGFSVWHEVGMLCAGWRCGGVKVLPLLSGFSYKMYLQHLSKILL
jgi:hypothetical protein